MNEYSPSSRIFQLSRSFSVRLDIILNEKNIHKVFDSSYAQEKNRKRFLKIQPKKRTIVSPVVGFCSQMFSLQIIPIFLCLHLYTNKNHPLKSSKQPYNCGSGLFLGGGAGGACRGACFPCVCVHTGMEKLLNTTDLASDTLIQNPV